MIKGKPVVLANERSGEVGRSEKERKHTGARGGERGGSMRGVRETEEVREAGNKMI